MADRYWILGTGTWDSTTTTNWSASSGGAGGASVPTAADNVFFDANSNVGVTAFTVTMATTPRVCNDFTASGLDGVMTLAGSSIGLTVSGSLTFPATNFTLTYDGTTTFNATTTGKTITTNGVSMLGFIYFNGAGGAWTLNSALSTTSGLQLDRGTVNLNNLTWTGQTLTSSTTTTRRIAFSTTGSVSLFGTGNVIQNTTSVGFTVTGTPNVYITSTGSTAINIRTTTSSPLFNLFFTGGTYVLRLYESINSGSYNSLDFTGFAGTLTNLGGGYISGDLKLSTGLTYTAQATAIQFVRTSGTQTITSNGKTLNQSINVAGGTFATVSLADNLTLGSSATLTSGKLDLAGFTLTCPTTFQTVAGTKNLTFNGGTLVCSAASATAFNNAAPTNFTTTAGTGTGTISMTAATAKTFVGGGSTFNCTLNQGGAGALTITGSNTFSNITNTVQPASVLFTAATTSTFTNFNLSGTSGNLITIGSVTAASHTLSKASGTVSASYLSISRSTATGGASWQAYTTNGNVDGGNNSGWLFSLPPPSTGNFLVFF